jgi:glycosyltransferase involved in cell wall biosynthesis
MRILLYYPRAREGDGGMSGALRRLSMELTEIGADVRLAYRDNGSRIDGAGPEWLPVRHTGTSRLSVPVGLHTGLRHADVLLLPSAWVLHNVWAAAQARRAGVPYVLAPRGAYDPNILGRKRALKAMWWRGLERRVLAGARAVHVFFESQEAHLEALGYSGPVVVAPNGVEPPDGVRWDGGSAGSLLWLGRFDPEHKGLDLLVEAMALIPEPDRPKLRLHGPDWRGRKSGVREHVRKLGLERWITIGGPLYGEEKWEAMRTAAGFVYPSRWEGFGNSAAEAAALGVPLLVTPYPLGLHLASRGGAILSKATASALAEALPRLASPEAADVGSRAADVAREDFSWRRVGCSWLEQLRALI